MGRSRVTAVRSGSGIWSAMARGEHGLRHQPVGARHLRGVILMAVAVLRSMEGKRSVEDGSPVLNGRHTARCERAAIAKAFHLVDDRSLDVAGENEVGMQRMAVPLGAILARLHGPAGGDESLGEHLPAEDARGSE